MVIPVWDEYVRYLDETLESLRAQEPTPQLLVVDNCSARKLPPMPGVRVEQTERRLSLGAARDFGLARVTTPLVVVWDADDLMPPRTLAALAEHMSADASLSIVAARIEEGNGKPHHWPRSFTNVLARRPRLLATINSITSQVPTIGAIMRTDTVRLAGGFPDLETGDDWVLGVALAFRGRVAVLQRVGRIYRLHGDSVWANRQTPTHLLAHARAVRAKLASDEAVPASIKGLLPLIGLGQWSVIRLVRPLARRLRV